MALETDGGDATLDDISLRPAVPDTSKLSMHAAPPVKYAGMRGIKSMGGGKEFSSLDFSSEETRDNTRRRQLGGRARSFMIVNESERVSNARLISW